MERRTVTREAREGVLAIYTTAPIERRTLKTLDVKRKGSWLLRTYCKGSVRATEMAAVGTGGEVALPRPPRHRFDLRSATAMAR